MARVIHLGVYEFTHGLTKKSIDNGYLATILESRYGIMQSYVDENIGDISTNMAQSVSDAIVDMMMGAPNDKDPLAQAASDLSSGVKKYISSREVETVLSGYLVGHDQSLAHNSYPVPTGAALKGINHRKKNPRTGVRRPSFIDTGLYESSIVAWTEEE